MSKGWQVSTLIASGLLWGSLAIAQVPGQAQDQPAWIQGYVVQTGSGEPLGKAQVMLRPERGRSPVFGAVTDSGGRFTLSNIQSGNYRLFVERDGYVDRQYGQVSANRPGTVLVLAPGQQVQDVVIRMVPTGAIAGRVFDEDGDPIVAADVRAMRFDYQDGDRVLRTVRQVETNDLGEYRLYWLTPEEYYLSASSATDRRTAERFREALSAAAPIGGGDTFGLGGGLAGPGGTAAGRGVLPPDTLPHLTEEAYVDTYYPGTVDPVAASPIVVQAGAEIRGVDFSVLPIRTVRVSGDVVFPRTEAEGFVTTVTIVPRNTVVAVRRNNRRGGRGNRAQSGRFELTDVAPGSYTLVATVRSGQGRGGGGQVLTGFADVEVGQQNVEGLRIQVQPGSTIAGQILVDRSAADIDVSRLRVRLEPVGDLPVGAPQARVEGDGTFVIDNVSPTLYRAFLTGLPENAYLAAGRTGTRDVLRDGVEVVIGLGPIQFWVSGAGGIVDGTVQVPADRAFTGAQVALIPNTPARADLYKVASADQYGRFSVRGIAPGRYRIFAWEDAPSGAYRDPDFVLRFRDMGEAVVIEQGSQVSVQPRLIPAG